jgi:hypothetical protein
VEDSRREGIRKTAGRLLSVAFHFSAVTMDINNNDGPPLPPPPPHPPPPDINDDPMEIDDDMEDEETQRVMEMEYLTELQPLYDLSSPAARKESTTATMVL